LFKTNITPDWHVGNNLSREVVNWLLLERRSAAAELIERFRRTSQPGTSGWPIVLKQGTSPEVPLELAQDASGNLAFKIPDAYLEPSTNPLATTGHQQIKGWGSSTLVPASYTRMSEASVSGLVIKLLDYEQIWISQNVKLVAKTPAAAVALRCLHEYNLVLKILSGQSAEDAEASMRNGSPVSYFTYLIGDALFSWGSIYAIITGTDFVTGTGLRGEQYAMHAGMTLLTALPMIGGVIKSLVGGVVKKQFIGTGVTAQADLLTTLKGNIKPLPEQTINVPTQVASNVDDLATGGKNLGTTPTTTGKVGLSTAAVKDLVGVVTREAAEQTTRRFLMHTGFARLGPGVVERAGAQAPIGSVFYGLGNAAKRPLPHPSLAKVADIRGSSQLLGRVNDDGLRARIASAYAHDPVQADRLITALCGKPECFPAGTRVLMADGSAQPIEQIAVGDLVATRSDRDATAPLYAGMVTRTFVRRSPALISVAMTKSPGAPDMIMRSTTEHPMWVVGRGWTEAADLCPGQSLVGDQPGARWTVREVAVEPAVGEGVLVYNLEVAGAHTYLVGTSMNPTGPPANGVAIS